MIYRSRPGADRTAQRLIVSEGDVGRSHEGRDCRLEKSVTDDFDDAEDEHEDPPSAQEVACRLFILKATAAVAFNTPPRSQLKGWRSWLKSERAKSELESKRATKEQIERLKAFGFWDRVSPLEGEFFEATPLTLTQQQHVNASWRLEAVQVLLWALGVIDNLPPYDEQAETALLQRVPMDDVQRFVSSAELRERSEIESARELAELWHWRSRTRTLIERGDLLEPNEELLGEGIRTYDDIVRKTAKLATAQGDLAAMIDEDFPVRGAAYRDASNDFWSEVTSITIERHHTLNWLCGFSEGNSWDDVPTDT
jgi:hypothetical protein